MPCHCVFFNERNSQWPSWFASTYPARLSSIPHFWNPVTDTVCRQGEYRPAWGRESCLKQGWNVHGECRSLLCRVRGHGATCNSDRSNLDLEGPRFLVAEQNSEPRDLLRL